jgi:flagellar basal-body rod protein FlgF
MDRIVYTSMGGAERLLEQQAVISNNLANVNTDGFRGQVAVYRSVPVVGQNGMSTRVSTVTATPTSDFRQGRMEQTGRALDVAITGEGWFAVQAPDGSEAYTRDGKLQVNAQGQLVTPRGLPLLSTGGAPVQVPRRGTLRFSADGRINVLGPGDKPTDLQAPERIKLVNPPTGELVRGDDGLFRLTKGADNQPRTAPPDPEVKLVQGYVEKSNVSPVETMVRLIDNARRYEMHMKSIQDTGTNEDKGNSILAVGN